MNGQGSSLLFGHSVLLFITQQIWLSLCHMPGSRLGTGDGHQEEQDPAWAAPSRGERRSTAGCDQGVSPPAEDCEPRAGSSPRRRWGHWTGRRQNSLADRRGGEGVARLFQAGNRQEKVSRRERVIQGGPQMRQHAGRTWQCGGEEVLSPRRWPSASWCI